MDSSNTVSFEEKFELLEMKWRLHDLEDDNGLLHQFLDWFKANKANVILNTMLLPVRERAGLGSPPEPFYTNSSECINNVLKVKMDYRRNELCQFVEKLHQLIDNQQQEVEKALVGCGKYCLHLHYSGLEIAQGKWFSMTKEQRRKQLKKFNDMSVALVTDLPSCSSPGGSTDLPSAHSTVEIIPSTSAHSTVEIIPSASQASELSSKLSSIANRLGLPCAAIEGIAKKAGEILSNEGGIVHAPGHPANARMVISRSGKRPHLVIPKKKSGGLACDDECPQYKSAFVLMLLLQPNTTNSWIS